jgi:hypothetical protein
MKTQIQLHIDDLLEHDLHILRVARSIRVHDLMQEKSMLATWRETVKITYFHFVSIFKHFELLKVFL